MKSLLAICTLSLLAAGCMPSSDTADSSCQTGRTIYADIIEADTTGEIPENVKAVADKAYAVLNRVCEKETLTEADIVLAAYQVYILTKSKKDAN